MAWEPGELGTGCAGGSSDAGDKQKPGTPELHKHIDLQFRLNFFFFPESFRNHCCEKFVLFATC